MPAPTIFIKDEFAQQKEVTDLYIKQSGIWTRVLKVYIKNSEGIWKLTYLFEDYDVIYDEVIFDTVNPFVDAGSPAGITQLNILVTTRAQLWGAFNSDGMVFTGMPNTVQVNLVVNGTLAGRGGRGGIGGAFNAEPGSELAQPGSPGVDGNTGLVLGSNLTLTGSGLIRGGCRGGRGGNGVLDPDGAGGGGGGGIPYGLGGVGGPALTSPPFDGDPGQQASADVGGAGGLASGAGTNGFPGSETDPVPAIITNGWILENSGFTGQVIGAIV